MDCLLSRSLIAAVLVSCLLAGCRTKWRHFHMRDENTAATSARGPAQSFKSPPSSGIFFNDHSDGDIRGRPENVFGIAAMEEAASHAEKSVLRVYDVRDLVVKLDDFPGVDIKLRSGAEDAEAQLRNRTGASPRWTESYRRILENPYRYVEDHPLSTFGLDVDTAAYSNVRRFLNNGSLPPADAVRTEEMINYFEYDYPEPQDGNPFAVFLEVGACPWNPLHRIARIGIKAKSVRLEDRPQANLVFLLDVSGSMRDENKLPLLKKAMTLLVEQLRDGDRVAVVTFSEEASLVLDSTPCTNRAAIFEAFDALRADGSTHWSDGAELAYRIASEYFIPAGINRVVLATDGDFNVGVVDEGGMIRLIEEKAKSGVFLTALGFGTGNYKDSNLEAVADRGNGNAAYIDDFDEAKKVLVEGLAGTLHTVAKDVKVQVEFNPLRVSAYRLIGYENRILAKEDFRDDAVDAGDVGAGHTVTALYEIVPAGGKIEARRVEALRYQETRNVSAGAFGGESLFLKIRYKEPGESSSRRLCFPVTDFGNSLDQASTEFLFACAAASFGLLLRDSKYKGSAGWDTVLSLAREGLGRDPGGRRTSFQDLVRKAASLAGTG